jgi:RluA family pseudouridine synthase
MNRAAPREYILSCTVDPYRSGSTLHDFLARRFHYHPASIWRERLESGVVRVNGQVASAGTIVGRGDRVEYTLYHAEPPVDFRYRVLFEDQDLLAVSKSGNLPVHAGGKFIANTLVAKLRETWGRELRPAHRLDRETSGVIVFAKSRDVARSLEREFRERRVEKVYLAILRGELRHEVIVDGPIARREPSAPPYFRVVDAGGKHARTRFAPLATGWRREGERMPITLVRALPEEGRTNQIRVHAAHSGHPILGDKIYGVPEELAKEFVKSGETERVLAAAGAPRHLLHCAKLTLAHPRTGADLRLDADLPPDFALAWEGDFSGIGAW